jgi:hypothetical protein
MTAALNSMQDNEPPGPQAHTLASKETQQALRGSIEQILGYAPYVLVYDAANGNEISDGSAYITQTAPKHQSVVTQQGLLSLALGDNQYGAAH